MRTAAGFKFPVGAVLGGILGALALLLLAGMLIAFVLFARRRPEAVPLQLRQLLPQWIFGQTSVPIQD